MQQSPPDLIGLLVILFAGVASQEIANATASYFAILMLATAGAFLALSSEPEPRPALSALNFICVRVFVAIVLTVSVAELFHRLLPWAVPRYTLIPIAFLIGWTVDFNAVRSAVGSFLSRILDKRAGL